MAIVFSCIASHTPLLMPTIGKDNLSLLDKTKTAMEQLEQELYTTHPDTILIISPHGDALQDALTINLSASYVTDFKEFGDITTKETWKPNTMLIDRIREDFKDKHLPLVLDSKESLDYGTAVPLWYLTKHLPKIKVIPVITSGMDLEAHYKMGKQMKDELLSSTERVAIVASADLSHCLSENAPGGFHERGASFDARILELMQEGANKQGMLDIDDAWAEDAQACGAKVISLMMGMVDNVRHTKKVLSYEAPFGVGYLVSEMKNM